jgi:hypothetical protein
MMIVKYDVNAVESTVFCYFSVNWEICRMIYVEKQDRMGR